VRPDFGATEPTLGADAARAYAEAYQAKLQTRLLIEGLETHDPTNGVDLTHPGGDGAASQVAVAGYGQSNRAATGAGVTLDLVA
jgi:hypothetical protein